RKANNATTRTGNTDHKAPSTARSLAKFIPAALRTALSLSPSVPLSRFLSIRRSSLRCPILGSIAARRFIQRQTDPAKEPPPLLFEWPDPGRSPHRAFTQAQTDPAIDPRLRLSTWTWLSPW